MACKIFDTKAGEYFFDSPGFLESFGDWINGEVPYLTDERGKITSQSRVLKDGSPRIYFNRSKTQAFYYDKLSNKIPILNVEFSSIPAEVRWEIAYGVNDALLYGVYQEIGLEEGPYSTLTSDKTLSELYDSLVEDFKEYDLEPAVERTLDNDKEDHINLLKQRLYNMGIKYRELEEEVLEEEATDDDTIDDKVKTIIVQKPSYERKPSDAMGADIKFLLEFSPVTNSRGDMITSPYIPSSPLFMDSSKAFAILLDNITNSPQQLKDSSFYTASEYGEAKNSIDIMMDRMKKVSNKYPWMKDLVRILEGSNEEFKLQFLQSSVAFYLVLMPGIQNITL